MEHESERKRVLSRAYRLLSIRARSEGEMRRSLRSAGFDEPVIEDAIVQLRQQRLLDDHAFAAEWVRSRTQSRPRGKRLIERELREKGITGDEAAEATAGVDDETAASALAARRAGLMRELDRQTFIRRLSNYLLVRGFSRETVSRAVNSELKARGDS